MCSGDVSPGAFLKRCAVVIGIERRRLFKMFQRQRWIAGQQCDTADRDFVDRLRSRATVDRRCEYTTSDECSGSNTSAPLQVRTVDITDSAQSLT